MANTTTSDRITRAAEIIKARAVARFDYGSAGHCWGCDSSDGKRVYRVTETDCKCPDFQKAKAICKHMLAGPGAPAVALILKMRACYSLAELLDVATFYAPAIQQLADGFRQMCRDEYRAACNRIVNRITFAQEVAA